MGAGSATRFEDLLLYADLCLSSFLFLNKWT